MDTLIRLSSNNAYLQQLLWQNPTALDASANWSEFSFTGTVYYRFSNN